MDRRRVAVSGFADRWLAPRALFLLSSVFIPAGGCGVVPFASPFTFPLIAPVAGSNNVAVGPFINGGSMVILNPLAAPALVPGGILIGQPTLEGRWDILGSDGSRTCVTVQESHLSIVILDCTTTAAGRPATITAAPVAAVAGPNVVLTATIVPELFSNETADFTFSGVLQADGTYVGQLRILINQENENEPELFEVPAVMAR
jgi:hypothetical protein